MKKSILIITLSVLQLFLFAANPPKEKRNYFEIRIYHFDNKEQQKITEDYLQNNYIPALHKAGIKLIGVFKPVEDDTAADKKIYVLIPYSSLKEFEKIKINYSIPGIDINAANKYVTAPYDKPVFNRMETILVRAFEEMPGLAKPTLTGPRNERVYELRSYESASEKIFQNKVDMFNKGGEVDLFKRLGFNAIFYSEVIAGARMPNLMYMTSFENKKERDEHWKTFSADEEWKKLSAMPQYQHNVAKIDITFLRPTSYSDY